MAGARTFKVIFDGDSKGLGSAVDEAGGKLGKFGGAISSVASIAGGFVLGQGLLKLPGFLTDAAKGAAEDEAATARLQQTFKNYADMAGAAPDTFQKLNDLLNDRIGIGQKLAFTDDDVRDSFNKLLTATDDSSEATKRQQAAMDLARGAGISLGDATKILSKLSGENVEVLKKMGITIGDNATEADALAAVQARFGGQAEAYAKSTAGQFEQLQIRMAEAKETIGAALMPVMIAVGDVLATKVVPAIEDFATKVGPALGAAGAFLQDNLLPPLQKLADWFTGNQDAMQAAAVAIGTVLVAAFIAWAAAAGAAAIATLAAAAPVLAIVAAIALLAAGVFLLIKHWDDITAKFPILGQAADAIQAKFAAFSGWITGTFVPAVLGIYNGIKSALDQAIAYVVQHADDIKNAIEPPLQAIALIGRAAFEQLKTEIETVWGVIKGVIDVFMGVFTGDWDRAWQGVKEIVSSVWNGIKGTIENAIGLIKGLAPLMGEAGKALLDAFWEGMQGIGGKLEQVIEAIGKGIANGIIAVVNKAIQTINNMIPDKISLTGLPDIDLPDNPIPEIPALARGGIVTRPTLALIGEAGPEAVIPLGRGRGAGTAVELHIHAEGILIGSMEELAERIGREFARAY